MTWAPEYVRPNKIIIHHTASGNNPPDPAAVMRSIYYYHAVSLGWGDIGYNYLFDQYGNMYEGRAGGNMVVGAHAYGQNYGSVGLSVIGNFVNTDITSSALTSLID
ncbi:N-acetylmuramoyl-L-alanine amidase, partial [Patescibacteria group bacterium]|nr:N-acetylmuramoyl-L-alanine amidase [Patescibacteria group bacterium]